MAIESKGIYEKVSGQLPSNVAESTRITATWLALGRANAGDFCAAHDDSRIHRASKGTQSGEARFTQRVRFFGRSR